MGHFKIVCIQNRLPKLGGSHSFPYLTLDVAQINILCFSDSGAAESVVISF